MARCHRSPPLSLSSPAKAGDPSSKRRRCPACAGHDKGKQRRMTKREGWIPACAGMSGLCKTRFAFCAGLTERNVERDSGQAAFRSQTPLSCNSASHILCLCHRAGLCCLRRKRLTSSNARTRSFAPATCRETSPAGTMLDAKDLVPTRLL